MILPSEWLMDDEPRSKASPLLALGSPCQLSSSQRPGAASRHAPRQAIVANQCRISGALRMTVRTNASLRRAPRGSDAISAVTPPGTGAEGSHDHTTRHGEEARRSQNPVLPD